jgi:anti-sigma-K factor RskA
VIRSFIGIASKYLFELSKERDFQARGILRWRKRYNDLDTATKAVKSRSWRKEKMKLQISFGREERKAS